MDTSKLAPETRRVWNALSVLPALSGFVLIGGTALTMHLAHRVSEDLDFVALAPRLPGPALTEAIATLRARGFTIDRNDDDAAYEEFLIAGQSLHDHQQDFLIDRVKVTFFTADDHMALLERTIHSSVRVASLPELFRTKVLAAAQRCASRDWIDLYVLLKSGGFTPVDLYHALHRPGIFQPDQLTSRALQNLCRGQISRADPGYELLMTNAPSITALAEYFRSLRDDYETEQAKIAFLKKDA